MNWNAHNINHWMVSVSGNKVLCSVQKTKQRQDRRENSKAIIEYKNFTLLFQVHFLSALYTFLRILTDEENVNIPKNKRQYWV